MKKVVLSVVAALAVSAAMPAFAADMPAKAPKVVAPAPPPSPWDIAFGAGIMNDYIFRGVTQSGHKGSVAAYFEPRYNINSNWQLYAGLSGESIKFANNAAAEIDFYGGVRSTWGPLTFDVGYWYYYYPGGQCYGNGPLQPAAPTQAGDCGFPIFVNGNVAKSVASFYEVYGKIGYTWTDWAFGANFYYSPNFLNTGADGEYLSGTIKFTAPERMALGPLGWYVSGEFGHQWLGTSDAFYGCNSAAPVIGVAGTCLANNPNGIPYADYNTWNVGVGFTWKVFTLDLRYYDTDLSKGDCNAFTSDPTARGLGNATAINAGPGSSWCGASFVAKLSADLTLGSLK
ncbi:MAG: TorF family putative porin [Pseudolabrys sp.]